MTETKEKEIKHKRIRHPKNKQQKEQKEEQPRHFVLDVHSVTTSSKSKIGG